MVAYHEAVGNPRVRGSTLGNLPNGDQHQYLFIPNDH